METRRFVQNKCMFAGPQARKKIGEIIDRYRFRKAFVVTDPNLVELNLVDKIACELTGHNTPYVLFSRIQANPTIENVQQGVDAFRESGADFILSFGGGSAIDTAKGVGIIAGNPEFYNVVSLEGADKSRNPSVPVIAVPTTAGTGSETTMDYVITNEREKRKMACMDVNAVPVAAILDTEIMSSMPRKLTAATAMDALTHAIESYTAKGAWTVSRMYSLKAVELIAGNLEQALDFPGDLAAREGLAIGQYLAGAAFTNAGLGIVHSMAHPLSARYNIHHGVANAMILPYVMEYNMDCVYEQYACIAEAFGNRFSLMAASRDKAMTAVRSVRYLLDKTGLPVRLSQVGVESKELKELSGDAYRDVSTLDNPKDVSRSDILAIYERMY